MTRTRPRGLLQSALDDVRNAELAEAEDLVGDLPEDGRHGAALQEAVAAEAREALDAEGEVELELFLEPVLLDVGQDRVGELLRLGNRERRVVERDELAVHPDHGRRVRRDVKVRSPALDERLEELMQGDRHCAVPPEYSGMIRGGRAGGQTRAVKPREDGERPTRRRIEVKMAARTVVFKGGSTREIGGSCSTVILVA